MKALESLPYRIPVLECGSFRFWMKMREALELLRARRAQEIFSEQGEFVGIEVGKFGPQPTALDNSVLPPRELPGIYFKPPASAKPILGQIQYILEEIAFA